MFRQLTALRTASSRAPEGANTRPLPVAGGGSGFAEEKRHYALTVDFPAALEAQIDPAHRAALRGVLAHDPRPSYQSDPERIYGVAFAGKNVKFTVEDGVLTVRKIEEIS